jgi:uncharacterized protein (DUF302 family)
VTDYERLGITATLAAPYEEALERVKAALKSEGFGVLTEIDVRATLQEKLGVSFRPYTILGACNPPLAHRALTVTGAVGLMLPCNVVVEALDGGGSRVTAMDPLAGMAMMDVPALTEVAAEVRRKMERAISSLG